MHAHRDHDDELLRPDDYLTGDDNSRAIPRVTGIPQQRVGDALTGLRTVRQRDRRAR